MLWLRKEQKQKQLQIQQLLARDDRLSLTVKFRGEFAAEGGTGTGFAALHAVVNQCSRWALEPWVQVSGLMARPVVCSMWSSPTAAADLSTEQYPVAWLLRCSVLAPHAGEAVGLQLERDRGGTLFVGLVLDELLLVLLNAEKVLNMMAEFVGDDVRLCEVGRGTAELRQFIPEAEVDGNFSSTGR